MFILVQRMGLEYYARNNEYISSSCHGDLLDDINFLPSNARLPSKYWYPLLDKLCKKERFGMVLEVVDSMYMAQVIPDKHCIMRYIEAALALRQYDNAIKITHTGIYSEACKKTPDLDVYKPIIFHLIENDLPTELVGIIDMMDRKNVCVDFDIWQRMEEMRRFDIVLEYLEKKGIEKPK